jgi:putative ABC transport system permease protein
VGTNLDYFTFRNLEISEGEQMKRLGDCVIGAEVAKELDLSVKDQIMSDPENVFDIAGTYPLNMNISGILKSEGTPDDKAIFTDIKTTWVIRGIAHGHKDLTTHPDSGVVLKINGNQIIANEALTRYMEITDENISSFHFHGKEEEFPVTAIIAVPPDKKAETLLRGRYLSDSLSEMIIVPDEVFAELMDIVFKIKTFFDANMILVALTTLLLLVLVVLLSMRLRQHEMEIMFNIGCSRWTMAKLQIAELAIIFVISIGLAGLLGKLTIGMGDYFIWQLIMV